MKRTLLKTITYRVLIFFITTLVAWVFTKNLLLAGSIGSIEIVGKGLLYFLHEWLWSKIKWCIKKE